MRIIVRLLFSMLLMFGASYAIAQDYVANSSGDGQDDSETASNIKAIRLNIYNLGQYLGYSLGSPPNDATNPNDMSPPSFLDLTQSYVNNTYIPAITMLTNIITQAVFTNYNASSEGDEASISANKLVDQQPFQQDPVSQSVLNVLTTPDYSYCLPSYNSTSFKDDPLKNCANAPNQQTNLKVVMDSIGDLPEPNEFFTYAGLTKNNSNLIAQLSSNALITPLIYSDEQQQGSSNNQSDVLNATTQAEEAENFIRYATGNNTYPIDLATWQQYESLYSKTLGDSKSLSTVQAQYALSQYLSSLRTFAAQTSVGINNLYYILSKRIKAKNSETSEAMTEYNMATWRLANINTTNTSNSGGGNNPTQQQWREQLMKAPPETVQKEIALLLAEINYQLYLSRQQQERLLLTNSILSIQSARTVKPSLLEASQASDNQNQ